jgi:hypothetical protein
MSSPSPSPSPPPRSLPPDVGRIGDADVFISLVASGEISIDEFDSEKYEAENRMRIITVPYKESLRPGSPPLTSKTRVLVLRALPRFTFFGRYNFAHEDRFMAVKTIRWRRRIR